MLPSDDVEKLAEIIYRHSQKTCTAKAEEYIVDLAGLEFTHFLAINDHNNQNCQKRGVNDGADVCNQQNLRGGARAKDEGGQGSESKNDNGKPLNILILHFCFTSKSRKKQRRTHLCTDKQRRCGCRQQTDAQ